MQAIDFARGLVPLWAGERGSVVDFVRLGAFALVDADGHLRATCGDAGFIAFLRSSAKPFQVLALLRRGLDGRLGLGAEEVACACGSHSGERRHVEAARRILSAAEIDEHSLLCGTHEPISGELRRSVSAGEVELSPVHNNCSGKHAAMLAVCAHEGWDVQGYPEASHPLQAENLATLALFAGIAPESIRVARDNCTVPTFALPLRDAARAAARLRDPRGLPEDLGSAARRAVAAMTAEPGQVGGTGRLDTAILEVTAGRLLVKTGASGFYLASTPPSGSSPALGLALKTAGAENDSLKAPVVLGALAAAGLLEPEELERLSELFVRPQLSGRGQEVGAQRFVGRIVWA